MKRLAGELHYPLSPVTPDRKRALAVVLVLVLFLVWMVLCMNGLLPWWCCAQVGF